MHRNTRQKGNLQFFLRNIDTSFMCSLPIWPYCSIKTIFSKGISRFSDKIGAV
nr:MAG TPA: hypothetical protein [Caudoviricetes sp.]